LGDISGAGLVAAKLAIDTRLFRLVLKFRTSAYIKQGCEYSKTLKQIYGF